MSNYDILGTKVPDDCWATRNLCHSMWEKASATAVVD